MSRRALIILGLCFVLPVLVAGIIWTRRGQEVTLVRPHRGTAVELVYATGFVEPDQPVSVSARVTAPVVALLAAEGEPVRQGQALLRLDDSDLKGSLRQARAQSLGLFLQEQRALTLFAPGWMIRADRDVAVANAEAARAATAVALAKLRQFVVRAGINGVVIKRDIQPGELAPPTRILMLLGDPAKTRITATIDERDIPRVHVGQVVLLSSDAWRGRIIPGNVRSLTPSGDPTQRAFRAYLAIDRRERLPIGMRLEANIISRRVPGAVLAPNSALVQDSVWTVDGGHAHHIAVRTGIVGTDTTQTLQGLVGYEPLIDRPSADLQDGARARVRS